VKDSARDERVSAIRKLIDERQLAQAEIQSVKLAQSGETAAASELLRAIGRASRDRVNLEVPEAYHRWYYDNLIWRQRTWAGVTIHKSPLDLWNYQEIISQLRPQLIIEFGAAAGGSALYFADLLNALRIESGKVVSVDIDLAPVDPRAKAHPSIFFIEASSTDPFVGDVLRDERPTVSRAFAILDSDHSKAHVYNEMVTLREVLQPGDYLVVEDGNINGHPVLPGWGDGPFEAIARYVSEYPDDYEYDREREMTFGWTFSPHGFLIRR
jgi:cephalosporin hydroxylase